MKRLALVVLSLSLGIAAAPAAAIPAPPRAGSQVDADPVPASRVSRITVHPDRARVTRTQHLSVAAGAQEIAFNDLPSGLDPDSVRAAGAGNAKAAIAGLEVRTVHLGAPANSQVRDLNRRILAFADQAKDLGVQVDAFEAAKRVLRTAATPAGPALGSSLASRSFDPKLWSGLLTFIETQDARISKSVLFAQRGIRSADEQRKVLEMELSQLRGFQPRERREVRVSLDVARAGDFDLSITYDVPGASWKPVYDLTLEPDLVHAHLAYRASVAQRTGEDWINAVAILSTSRPDLGSSPPELGEWVLDKAQPPEESGEDDWRRGAGSGVLTPSAASSRMAKTVDERQAEKPVPIESLEAGVESQGNAIQFEAARPVSLPGDGRPRHVPIGERTINATSSYRVVPRLSPHAYLTATLFNNTPWPLLPGEIRAHLGGDYVGPATLPEDVAPQASFSVSFGSDRQIKVERVVTKRMSGDRGFIINKRHRSEYAFKIGITNQKPVPISLKVVEPYPVSRREDIVVRLTGDARPPAKTEPQGKIEWTVVLPPGGKRDISWGYVLEWPEDLEIAGLE